MGAAPYGAKAKGADAPARRLRDIRRVHSWARRYYEVGLIEEGVAAAILDVPDDQSPHDNSATGIARAQFPQTPDK